MIHAIILLAAGSSSRMGQSKQLLPFEGEALLIRSAKAALAALPTVMVVLGSQFERHRLALAELPVVIIENKAWEKGMGGSLKAGLTELRKMIMDLETVTILVCDQPKVSVDYLTRLVGRSEHTEKSIIASSYSGVLGVPALFKKERFAELMTIPDDAGAAKLIRQLPHLVEAMDFPEGAIDLDTPDDYKAYASGEAPDKADG